MSIKLGLNLLRQSWKQLNGEAEYERYLIHWQTEHSQHPGLPLTRKQYFAALTERKWNGIKRCC